jgi:hypothetical protein
MIPNTNNQIINDAKIIYRWTAYLHQYYYMNNLSSIDGDLTCVTTGEKNKELEYYILQVKHVCKKILKKETISTNIIEIDRNILHTLFDKMGLDVMSYDTYKRKYLIGDIVKHLENDD